MNTLKMRVKAALLWLSTFADAMIVTTTENILKALTNNAFFPTPAPALAVIKAALDAFKTGIANAANGDRQAITVKNQLRAALVALLRDLGSYLTVTSAGDLAKLQSSMFPYQKPVAQPIGTLGQPFAPQLYLGEQSGQLDAYTPRVYGGYTYNWRLALASAPNVYLQTMQTTAASITFEGLTPGETYLVDVNVVGAAGASDWSPTGILIVV